MYPSSVVCVCVCVCVCGVCLSATTHYPCKLAPAHRREVTGRLRDAHGRGKEESDDEDGKEGGEDEDEGEEEEEEEDGDEEGDDDAAKVTLSAVRFCVPVRGLGGDNTFIEKTFFVINVNFIENRGLGRRLRPPNLSLCVC